MLGRAGERVGRQVAGADAGEAHLANGGPKGGAHLVGVQTLEGAVALAEKLRVAISRARCSVSNGDGLIEIEVTASLGVAAFRGDEKAFFNDADRALYRRQIAGQGLRRRGRRGRLAALRAARHAPSRRRHRACGPAPTPPRSAAAAPVSPGRARAPRSRWSMAPRAGSHGGRRSCARPCAGDPAGFLAQCVGDALRARSEEDRRAADSGLELALGFFELFRHLRRSPRAPGGARARALDARCAPRPAPRPRRRASARLAGRTRSRPSRSRPRRRSARRRETSRSRAWIRSARASR